MRRRLTLLSAILLALAAPAAVRAAKPNLAFPGAGKVSPELRERLLAARGGAPMAEESFAVVVGLDPMELAGERASAYRSRRGLEDLHARIEQVQERVLAHVDRGKLQPLYRYQALYGFSALADEAAIRALAAHAEVLTVEEMPVHYRQDSQSFPLTGVDLVHNAGFSGLGTTIAIIDDGIDYDHAAFGGYTTFPNAKIIGGYDFGNFDSNPGTDCAGQTHGTATTGVAVGNGGGVKGTAPGAKVVFLKIQRSSECGLPTLGGDIVGAIDWVVANRLTYGIRVVSMSFGAGPYSSVSACDSSHSMMRSSINSAYAAGLVLVAAAGNDAATAAISRPACFANVISVGAVYDALMSRSYGICSDFLAPADRVTCYSNSASFLDVWAPAECALTAQAGGTTNSCFGGTSSATPFTAGVAANLIQRNGSLNNDGVRGLLTRNGKSVTNSRNGITKPRVDAAASLRELYDLTSCQWSAGIKESNGTAYTCPSSEVMVGRKHSGDENGTTNYYCCAAGNPVASRSSCSWSGNVKESNGTAFVCPFNQYIAGRQHSGDENGYTKYYCCNLLQGGSQVPIAPGTCGWSPGVKESSSNFQCSPAGKVLVGRQHVGDENGTTYHYCCNPQW